MKQSKHERDARTIGRYAKNILQVYEETDELTRRAGLAWYALEAKRCRDFAAQHRLSWDAVAGAAAAISPGMRWEFVLSHVAALVRNPSAKVPTYNKEFVRRAVRCLNGEDPLDVLSGPKVIAFYKLLARIDIADVVIDGHAFNIARGVKTPIRGAAVPKAARVTQSRYDLAAEAYRRVAKYLDIEAYQVQAITWIHWRR